MINDDQIGTPKLLRWLIPIIWLIDVVLFTVFDRKWIFPLKDHADFSFQLAFELGCIVVSASTATAWVIIMRNPTTLIAFQQRPRWVRGFIDGLPWGVSMFLLNGVGSIRVHQFEAWSFLGNLLLWLISGWGWGFTISGLGKSTKAVVSSQ